MVADKKSENEKGKKIMKTMTKATIMKKVEEESDTNHHRSEKKIATIVTTGPVTARRADSVPTSGQNQ